MMRLHHVGNLLVMNGANGDARPVGIVTDRDITISVVATKLDPAVFTVGDLLTTELVAANEDQGVFETIQQMRVKGIRRLPVVDRDGKLVGILSLDDLIQLLAEEMSELAKLITEAKEAQPQAHGAAAEARAVAPHDTDTNLTREGASIGTTGYMSPEQVQGLKLDARRTESITERASFSLSISSWSSPILLSIQSLSSALRL